MQNKQGEFTKTLGLYSGAGRWWCWWCLVCPDWGFKWFSSV